MRYSFLVLTWVLTFLGTTAQAADECPALSKLFRILKSLDAAQSVGTPQKTIPAINAIAQDVISIDAATIEVTFRESLEADQRDVLGGLLQLSQNVLLLALQDDLFGAANLIWSDQMGATMSNSRSILKSFECVEVEAITELTDLIEEPKTAGDIGDVPEESASPGGGTSSTLFIGAIVMAIAIIAAASISRLVFLRKRRSRRYELYYVVRWRDAGQKDDGREGVIKDINCYGFRLDMIEPPENGDLGEIQLQGQWHPVTVQWTKEGQCGLKLVKRIRVARVLLILRESRKISRGEPAAA